jgi:dGTP triphosphohydrolase
MKKFKVHLHQSIYNYLNYNNQNSNNDKKKIFLYRIDTTETKKTNKSASIKWFKKKLRDVFSCKLSKKCSTKEELYNKIEIEKIFSEGKNKEMMEKLEKTVRNMYNSYIKDEKIEGFKTLKDDIEDLKQEMKANGEEKLIDNYIKKYIHTAFNFEEILSQKTERNKKKKINIIIEE